MSELTQRDIDLIELAREIAIDHYDIEDVLTRYQLSYDEWSVLLEHPRFIDLLSSESEAWESAKNTKERVKLKSAALIESYLESAQASLSDPNETLVAKTGLAKLIASFAGMGGEESKYSVAGSGFSITINLGDRTVNLTSEGEDTDQIESDDLIEDLDEDEDIEDADEVPEDEDEVDNDTTDDDEPPKLPSDEDPDDEQPDDDDDGEDEDDPDDDEETLQT